MKLSSTPIVVLSPHPDDAVLSCGGLLLHNQQAAVVTVFSADPPGPRRKALAGLADPILRRAEDALAMDRLGCEYHQLDLPDAIDRGDGDGHPIYSTMNSVFGSVKPVDSPRCGEIQEAIEPLLAGRTLLCPMAVGAHVDHQLCAHVGRRLQQEGHDVWFYEDAPYIFPDPGPAVNSDTVMKAARRLRAHVQGDQVEPIDAFAKAELVSCYSSQIEALFGDLARYRELAAGHYQFLGGEVERFYKLRLL